MSALHAVAVHPDPAPVAQEPLRPGLVHERVELALGAALAVAVEDAAAAAGLSAGAWAALAIESERALRHVADALGCCAEDLAIALDVAAAWPAGAGASPLARYGRALAAATPRPRRIAAPRVTMPVPHHTLLAWLQAAAAEDAELARWAGRLLETLPSGRSSWEAAAAASGQTLAEWVTLRAAAR